MCRFVSNSYSSVFFADNHLGDLRVLPSRIRGFCPQGFGSEQLRRSRLQPRHILLGPCFVLGRRGLEPDSTTRQCERGVHHALVQSSREHRAVECAGALPPCSDRTPLSMYLEFNLRHDISTGMFHTHASHACPRVATLRLYGMYMLC